MVTKFFGNRYEMAFIDMENLLENQIFGHFLEKHNILTQFRTLATELQPVFREIQKFLAKNMNH